MASNLSQENTEGMVCFSSCSAHLQHVMESSGSKCWVWFHVQGPRKPRPPMFQAVGVWMWVGRGLYDCCIESDNPRHSLQVAVLSLSLSIMAYFETKKSAIEKQIRWILPPFLSLPPSPLSLSHTTHHSGESCSSKSAGAYVEHDYVPITLHI